MPSSNLAFILFSEQWLTANGLVLNLNFVQSADLSVLNNADSKKCNNFMFTLHNSTRTEPTPFFLKLLNPDPYIGYTKYTVYALLSPHQLYMCKYLEYRV